MTPPSLTIHRPQIHRDAAGTQILIPISDHEPVEFRICSGNLFTPSDTQLGNLCLTIGLLPAMRLGAALQIDSPVSTDLLRNAQTLTQIFHRWFHSDGFQKIPILANPGPDPPSPTPGDCACFFSGGVDSLHSVRQHRDELTRLIFVHGFDIPSDDASQATLVRDQLAAAAGVIGLPLTEVWTDLRAFSDPYCYWGHHYFGTALAAVAHLLSPNIHRAYIPGSCAFETLGPWGSHPLTDPLWGTPNLEIIHDGAGATRIEKVAAISGWDVARRFLRVCWEGPPGSYNCGRCEKCTRTQAALRATGALDHFSTFDAPLDLGTLAAQRAPYAALIPMIEDMLTFAREKNSDPELIDALDRSSRGIRADIAVRHFARHNRDALATSGWRRLLPKVRNKLFRSLSESDPDWFVSRLEKLLPTHRDAILTLLHTKDPKWLAKTARHLGRRKK
jgi:hypothetical protein